MLQYLRRLVTSLCILLFNVFKAFVSLKVGEKKFVVHSQQKSKISFILIFYISLSHN